MVTIDVYTTPTCMPCKILKKRLAGLACDNLKVNEHNALDYPEMNIMATPYIVAVHDEDTFLNGHLSASDFNKFLAEVKEYL